MELVQLAIVGEQRGDKGLLTATAIVECWLDNKSSIVQFFSVGETVELPLMISGLVEIATRQLSDLKRRLGACGVDVVMFDELADSIDYSSVAQPNSEVESARKSRLN